MLACYAGSPSSRHLHQFSGHRRKNLAIPDVSSNCPNSRVVWKNHLLHSAMASAARQAGFVGEHPQCTDDLKPVSQRTYSDPLEYSYPAYAALQPSATTQVKHEFPENYSFFAFTPSELTPGSSSAPLGSNIPHIVTPVTHHSPSNNSYSCPPPPSHAQLPPLLPSRQENSPSTWFYPSAYGSNRSYRAENFYQQERNGAINYPQFGHRSSLTAVRFSEPYLSHPADHAHPVNDYYPSLDEVCRNDCRSNAPRILYPQAIYPYPPVSPYIRPAPQHAGGGLERPFLCEKCGARFNRNHDLKRHTRIHLEVKPFPCGWCDKAFSRKDALKRHLMVKACSGSKEVSVEESVRRAQQLRQRKSELSSHHTANVTTGPISECTRKTEPLKDVRAESEFDSAVSNPFPSLYSASTPSQVTEKSEASPSVHSGFPRYFERERICSVSDDSVSTNGSATTCSN